MDIKFSITIWKAGGGRRELWMSEGRIAFEGLALCFLYVKTKDPEQWVANALVKAITHACQRCFPPENSRIYHHWSYIINWSFLFEKLSRLNRKECVNVIKEEPSRRYYPSVKCFQSVLWNNTTVDSRAAVKNDWENGTKPPPLRAEISCEHYGGWKTMHSYRHICRSKFSFLSSFHFYAVWWQNLGHVTGTRRYIILRRKLTFIR